MLEHNLCVVAKAVACGFGANKRTTVVETFAGKNTVVLINYSLVLAEKIAYFSAAYADIACGNIGVCADVCL